MKDRNRNNVMDHMPTGGSDNSPPTVSIGEAFWAWCRVAALSFGGPAGVVIAPELRQNDA